MTTHAWPSTLVPASYEWGFNRKVVQFPSEGDFIQSVDRLRWGWTVNVNMPPRQLRKAGALEAFFNGLVGGVDRVTLHRLDRPVPKGTLRGAPVLAANMAQFSALMQLAEAWDVSRRNIFPYSNEIFLWRSYALGVSMVENTVTAPDGTLTAEAIRDDLGTSDHFVDRYEAYVDGAGVYTMSCHFFEAGHMPTLSMQSTGNMHTAWFHLAAGTAQVLTPGSGVTAGMQPVGGGWWRCWITANITATASPIMRIGVFNTAANSSIYSGDGSSGIYAWGVQLNAGSLQDYIKTGATGSYAPATLKAGDMLGVGSQLFQVHTDAAANDAGQLAVTVINRTRATVAAGTAVVWNKPTATFMVQDTSSSFSFGPGSMAPSSFRLIEVP